MHEPPILPVVSGGTPRIPTTVPGPTDPSPVSVKSLAVIVDPSHRRHLVFRARTQAGAEFHRPLGGTVELGERSLDAAIREIREELGATFVPESLLGVVETIFELDGEVGHEIDFLYVGSLDEPDAVPVEGRAFDDLGSPGWAEWRPVVDPPQDVSR